MASAHDRYLRWISGENGLTASAARMILRAAETPYAGLMRLRNRLYDRQRLAARRLGRPTISVGNLTAGGTGKTPVVRWLAGQLIAAGHRPAILLRGYGGDGQSSDEAELHSAAGVPTGGSPAALVHVNPDRVAGANRVLQEHPEVDVFILDDGFQHRRAARDFDLVLVNCAAPWGFGHVHPRGLLREPLEGLRRANANLLTHAEAETPAIEATIRRYNPDAPIYRCTHELGAVHGATGRRCFVFSGIGFPQGFESAAASRFDVTGTVRFPDHHRYTADDLRRLQAQAATAGADFLLTTEKDWVKIRALPPGTMPIVWLGLELRFTADDEPRLLQQIMEQLLQQPRRHQPGAGQ